MANNQMISVVVPVYGCVACLGELAQRLGDTLTQLTSEYEILLVCDASPDDSWRVIREISQRDPRIKGINFSRNFGQHYAITAGLDHAQGDWVVVMDCDLQDQPEEIPKLYAKAQEGFDIVLGSREERQDSGLKKLSSKMFNLVFNYLTDTKHDGSVANFGIYSRKAINAVLAMRENLRSFPMLVHWVGFRSTTIPIRHAMRGSGKSSYSLRRLFKLATDVMIAFSDKPLRLTIRAGLTISGLSFLYALYIIIRALLGIRGIEGWPSLIVSIWFLSGLIIFTLGIIGLYIGKIFDEVKSRPMYLIDETTFTPTQMNKAD